MEKQPLNRIKVMLAERMLTNIRQKCRRQLFLGWL